MEVEDKIVCEDCGAVFKSTKTLKEHQNKKRCKKESSLVCDRCKKSFTSRQRKHDHRRRFPNCQIEPPASELADPADGGPDAPTSIDLDARESIDPNAPSTSAAARAAQPSQPSQPAPAAQPSEPSQPAPAAQPSEPNVAVVHQSINNVATNNGIINNGTIQNVYIQNIQVVNLTPRDFLKTNTQVVIDEIAKNPAYMQLAHENELLLEAVIEKTHYNGSLENRNVYSAERKGKYMDVAVDLKRCVIPKKVGISQSIKNVNTIVNAPEVRPFLESDPTKPVFPVPQTRKEERFLWNKHERMFISKGAYPKPDSMVVPVGMPVFVPHADLVDMLLAVVDGQQSPYRHEVPMYHEFTLAACGHFVFNEATGKWFKGLPHGWEVLKDVARVESEIHIVLNDLKNAAKAKAIDDAKLRTGVDYFPDRLVASAAVGWVITASSGPALEPEKLECLEA